MDIIIQQHYNDDTAVCYGCGKNNPHGLHLQTHWDGTEGVCHFTPQPHHTAFPGVVYGGILASLIDCHSICTAYAASRSHTARSVLKPATTSTTFIRGTGLKKW